jgi:predicted PurR-regulated permease PerM
MHFSRSIAKNGKVSVVMAVAVTIAALWFCQDVLIPLVLSILLAFLLAPLCDWFERLRLGRAPSVIVVVLITFLLVVALAWVVGRQVVALTGDLPQYRSEILNKVRSVRGTGGAAGDKIGELAHEIKKAAETPTTMATQPADTPTGHPARLVTTSGEQGEPTEPGHSPEKPLFTQQVNATTSPFSVLAGYLGLVLGPLGTAGIVFVFTFFMLLEREDLRDRLLRLISRGKYTTTTVAVDDATQRISRYLVAQLIVNGTYGVGAALGLWAIGFFADKTFPSFVLWGLLCALLRFIPYIGPWIAAAFPILLSVIVYPGFTVFLVTTGMFVALELVSNNFMEPWLYGSSTGMSTTAVLVSAVFWTWLWGPMGLLLATPMTVCLVVIGKYVKQFSFLDVLLGDQPALAPSVSYYQRLLADDREDAIRVMQAHSAEVGADRVPDDVMIPALRMARRDRRDGDLSAEMENTVYEGTAAILRDVVHKPSADDREGQPLVLGCAAHHQSEELVVHMLREILPQARVEVISTRQLPSEIEDRVANDSPAVVFVAVVPPGGLTQARYLCRRLRRRFPDQRIVVGFWGSSRDFDTLLARFRSAGVRYVATSLLQTRSYIESILPKQDPPPKEASPSRPVPGQDNPPVPPEAAEPVGNA